jgi:transposase
MRGKDIQQSAMFSYVSPEDRVPADHPLRPVRLIVDLALKELSPVFNRMYVAFGRPSIAPEKLLRALLLQILYTIRSERMLMEQLEYNLLFRWFVGLNMDEPVWVPTVFSKNRDRLMEGNVAQKFFDRILEQAEAANLTSDEHFSVDGTLIEAGQARKAFSRRISRHNHRRMIRAIPRSIFVAKRGVTIPMSRRPIRMHVWRVRAAVMNRSWLTAATC